MVDVADRSTNTKILGEPASLPLALAPIGLCGMQHGDGEILGPAPVEVEIVPAAVRVLAPTQ